MERRTDLGQFLRARREALSPADVGLPDGTHRRTPGLRREEIAMLAGVSVTWYTWLEQGRPINASHDVLAALARSLRLDEAERDHLLALAGADRHDPPDHERGLEPIDPPDALTRLIAAMEPAPSYVLGPRWELVAWNRPQAALYPMIDRLRGAERNLVWAVFAEPSARRLLADWPDQARRILAEFRASTAGRQSDPALKQLIERLLGTSPEFAEWWPRHDVARFRTRLRHYHHPRAGDLVFEYQQLTPSEWPDLRVVCQLPVEGDDSAARLAAWHEVG